MRKVKRHKVALNYIREQRQTSLLLQLFLMEENKPAWT